MKELVLTIGTRRLIGVLAIPDRINPRYPVVLIPNTGIEHRVGPNRLHVILGRAFARQGYAALRLDLSGMGDSPPAIDGDAVQDLRAAMDALQNLGYGGSFAAVGLCSGAHDVHRLSLADQRVRAVACLDGYAYSTPRFELTFLWQRIMDPRRVLRFLIRRAVRKRGDAAVEFSEADYFRQPEHGQMRLELAVLMERAVHLCYIFSGDMQYVYNYAGQFADSFPELKKYPQFELHHMAHSDHTFTSPVMRADLVQRLLLWIGKTQPPLSAASSHLAESAPGA